jgi:putative nucleotidyltransferase with HDIG domain
MIKKIALKSLRIGMYVHDLDCSWLKHPFATNKFAVTTRDHIDKIKQAGIKQLTIDTDRGLDVEIGEPAKSTPKKITKPKVEPKRQPPSKSAPSDLKAELKRAVKVRREATEVVSGIMEDVRLGKKVAMELVTPVVQKMADSIMTNQNAMLGLTRIREMDQYTFEHSVSVSILLVTFAKHLGMSPDDVVEMGIGGLLHDIGKTKTPLKVLNKPAKLTDSEFETMRKHVTYSEQLLSLVPGFSDIALKVAAEHHERFDGSGYPNKKRGEEISLYGQMAAIVDVYDAITADRCYHKGMSPNAAIRKLNQWAGGHFNPELVQSFIHCVGIYPPGSLVSLSNGKFAVVLEVIDADLLHPVVRVIFDSLSRSFLPVEDIFLATVTDKALTIVGAVDPVKWRIDPTEYMDVPR